MCFDSRKGSLKMSEVVVEMVDENVEPLTYTERMFFDCIDGAKKMKPVSIIDCSKATPEKLPDGKIYLLLNYKSSVSRGRQDVLKGRNVLAFSSDKGIVFLPQDELVEAANYFYSLSKALTKKLEEKEEK